MVDAIKTYFDKYGLALNEPGQVVLRSNKAAIAELKEFVKQYEKEKRTPIYICCQSSINDFIVILQKYYKDGMVKIKAAEKVTKRKKAEYDKPAIDNESEHSSTD